MGINSIVAERLSEDGIDSIQQMALCNADEIISKTKFHRAIVREWKEHLEAIALRLEI